MVARQPWLVVEHLDDEVLVYDERSHRAHALSGAAAWLFEHEDEDAPFSRVDVEAARTLLETLELDPRADSRRGRRRALRTIAAGAMVMTIVAPRVAAAASKKCTQQCQLLSIGSPCNAGNGTCGVCVTGLICLSAQSAPATLPRLEDPRPARRRRL